MVMRTYQPTDAASFVALLQRRENHVLTIESFAESERHREADDPLWRVVLEVENAVMGMAELTMRPSTPTGWRDMKLIVAADAEGRGYGQALLTVLLLETQRQAVIGLETSVRDINANSRAWLERRGFSFDFHRFESELDLRTFNADAFLDAVNRVQAQNIRFANRAKLSSDDDLQKLHALGNRLFLDTPDAPGRTPLSFEQFKHLITENPQITPESVLVALDGQQLIGMTIIMREADSFYTGMTGVIREYRGLGIALALKVLSIQYALEAGAVRMTTHNHSKNAPMIAINMKLGYQQKTGLWVLKRHLQ